MLGKKIHIIRQPLVLLYGFSCRKMWALVGIYWPLVCVLRPFFLCFYRMRNFCCRCMIWQTNFFVCYFCTNTAGKYCEVGFFCLRLAVDFGSIAVKWVNIYILWGCGKNYACGHKYCELTWFGKLVFFFFITVEKRTIFVPNMLLIMMRYARYTYVITLHGYIMRESQRTRSSLGVENW